MDKGSQKALYKTLLYLFKRLILRGFLPFTAIKIAESESTTMKEKSL